MSALDSTAKSHHLLVTVIFNGTPYRYTNQSQQIGPYLSIPTMSFEPAPILGTLEPEIWTLELPADELSARLLEAGTKEPARVTIQEVLQDSRLAGTISRIKQSGVLSIAQEDPDNKQGWIRYKVSNDKQALATRPSFRLSETCTNTLFGPGCMLSEAANTFPGTVVDFNQVSRTAVITGFPLPEPLLYFTQGRIRRAGTVVDIRFWTGLDPQVFRTAQKIPPSWVGQEVLLTAGCTRALEACEGFDNTLNFNGIGRAVPKYNPQFETGE